MNAKAYPFILIGSLAGSLAGPLILGIPLPATAGNCPHQLDRLDGGSVSRQAAGSGAFQSVGPGSALCGDDLLRVERGARAWLQCQGSVDRRRLPAGVRRVGALCDSTGVGSQRPTNVFVSLSPNSNLISGQQLHLFVYANNAAEPGSNPDTTIPLEAFWPFRLRLLDPDRPTVAIYERTLKVAMGNVTDIGSQLTGLPVLQPGKDYHWTLQRLEYDETMQVSGNVVVVPPQGSAPTDRRQHLAWLLDQGYFGEALVLVGEARQAQPNDAAALAQWQAVLGQLDDLKGLGNVYDQLLKAPVQVTGS